MYAIILALGQLLVLASCSELNKEAGLKDDNKLEQFLEEQIQEKTGIKVDFTPGQTNE